jgi:hypothetical protein
MNNNSAVHPSSLIPEYPAVIFRGISHFRSVRCVLHVPHSILSRPLFIYFHLPLSFCYYYPYYSFLPLLFHFCFPRSLVFCVCRFHHSLRTTMSPHNCGQEEHARAFATFRPHVWTTYWWMIHLLSVTAFWIRVVVLITQGFLKPRVTTRHESLAIDREPSGSQHKQANFTR